MQKSPSKTKAKTRSRKRRPAVAKDGEHTLEHAYIVEGDRPTHVIVPVDEYDRMLEASMVQSAIEKLNNADSIEWVDADEFGLQLAGQWIAKARKDKRLTQKQLGDKLGLPQSQISRIERNPDRTTVRTLKRVARALGVNVRSLI